MTTKELRCIVAAVLCSGESVNVVDWTENNQYGYTYNLRETVDRLMKAMK